MNKKLSNKGLWLLFTIFIFLGISSYNYRPPCIPAYNSSSYTRPDGVIVVDATGCQPTIPGINDRMLLLAKVGAGLFSISAISTLVWIFKRRNLNKFYSQNAVQSLPVKSRNKFIELFKYWIKPILIGIVVIGLFLLVSYILWSMGLLKARYH
ncbi:MAG TPA: hypothetical protein VJH55_01255 [Candidatus Paceibacterota bacterium]